MLGLEGPIIFSCRPRGGGKEPPRLSLDLDLTRHQADRRATDLIWRSLKAVATSPRPSSSAAKRGEETGPPFRQRGLCFVFPSRTDTLALVPR